MYLTLMLLTLTLTSMARNQKLDPASPTYRQEVASHVQGLVGGRIPRDPRMSGASTGRLIVEGVVENMRIYRLHKQEKARETKENDEEERKKRGQRARRHHRDGSRGRDGEGRRNRSHGHKSHEDDGERHRRRHRHHSSCGPNGEECRHKRRNRRRSREGADKGVEDLEDQNQDQIRRTRSVVQGEQASGAQHLTSGALHAAGHLFGPDGTPFGALPSRGKGVGFEAHVKNTYRHIKAERDAGHRNKGFAENLINNWRQKKKDAKHAGKGGDEEPLVARDRYDHSEDDRGHDDRRPRRRSGRRRVKGGSRSVADSVSGQAGEPPNTLAPSQSARPRYQPLTVNTPEGHNRDIESSPLPRRSSRFGSNSDCAQGWSRGGVEANERDRSVGRPATVHLQSPVSSAHTESGRQSTQSIQSASSVRCDQVEGGESNRSAECPPTIRVQSPTPPEPVRTNQDIDRPLSMPATPSLPDVPTDRAGLLASIQSGVKLRKAAEADKKDKIEDLSSGQPVYEGNQHSQDVEALEHAQATEAKERAQEGK